MILRPSASLLFASCLVLTALSGCDDAATSQRLAVTHGNAMAAASPARGDEPEPPDEPDEPDDPDTPGDPPDDPWNPPDEPVTPPDEPDEPPDEPDEPPDEPDEPPDEPDEPPDEPDEPPDEPDELDGVLVESLPFVDTWDTTLGESVMDAYACAPGTNESGPEIVYRVTTPTAGLLTATLSGLPSDVDVDVHILDGDAPASCVDRGHWDAAAFLGPGDHTVVVDSWVDSSGVAYPGEYTVTIGFTPADGFADAGLDPDVFETALQVFGAAWKAGDTARMEYTVIDFSLHSMYPRLFTFDLKVGALLFAERVCHGEGSAVAGDPAWAERFSNITGSHQSSLGLMRTASRYQSQSNGLSLRLDGLEDGINDLVRPRAIVMHSDSYATPAFVETYGRMGTSWGCQVIDPARIDAFVDTVEGGSLVWSWYPDPDFVYASGYLIDVDVAGL